ncbi:MAG: prenyltransferase/squalene oxidase repeat-containing protein [Verrucomicrobiota bacterium]|nr:prenyltransferase/squalene oxidase repeat-containing protein [Verrucomicrobiota bacterium]
MIPFRKRFFRRPPSACLVALSLTCLPFLAGKDENASLPVLPPSETQISKSIDRGCEFLRKIQNKDGSWGSARQTKGLNIFAPVPGSHRAFRLAVTALSICALIENKGDDEEYIETIRRAQDHLLENLPNLRRATPMAIYNVWAHCYGLQALSRMHSTARESEKKQRIEEVMIQQVKMLQKYESVDGGWGYYDFNLQTKQPSGSSISFVNATGLVALKEAQERGIEIPKKLSDRAIAAIQRQRLPDHSYLYGEYLKYKPRRGINRPAGSLGRSHACNVALQLWGDETVTDQVHKICLDRLIKRNGWLDMGRKRPIPHESWAAVAGYFFYYGHLYASFCIETLKAKDQPAYKRDLATILVPLQEKDGSWWDFPFYDYHQQYGTAMALLSLRRCLPSKVVD